MREEKRGRTVRGGPAATLSFVTVLVAWGCEGATPETGVGGGAAVESAETPGSPGNGAATPEGEAVPSDALEVGDRYRFARATPVVRDLDPGDPAMAMAEPVLLPDAADVVVLARVEAAGTVWYQVHAEGGPTGWVSLEALRGREVLRLP